MSRFYSNHQITKTDKLLNEENLLDTSKYKYDLKSAINHDNHRINIDSAKKKAVLQRMDYDGFHQMVLGADIKGIKSKDMTNLKSNESIINHVMIHKKYNEEIDFMKGNFVVADKYQNENDKINKMKIGDNDREENLKESYKLFKKNWKLKTKPDEKVALLFDLSDCNSFENMLKSENMEADIFLDYLFNFGSYFLTEEFMKLDNNRKVLLIKSVKIIVDSESFNSLSKFLGKKQKNIYKEINVKKLEILNEDEDCLFILNSFINKLL
jgi:hypothetical protein